MPPSYQARALARRKRTKRETYFELLRRRGKRLRIALMIILTLSLAGMAYLIYSYAVYSHGTQLAMHIHARLTIIVEGQRAAIPANIGIERDLWMDHSLDAFMKGMAPIHTHDGSGTIHVESTVLREYTLGDFFKIWGEEFSKNCIFVHCSDGKRVRLFVDGAESLDFEGLILRDGQEIMIVYG